jgi:hypothetical protein
MKKTAALMLVSWVSDVEWVRQNENFPRASSFNERGSYEQYFEDDLNDLADQDDEEEEEEKEQEAFFAASILQKRMELNEITKERNHQIHIDGWGDLLNSILLHEKEYEEGLKLTTLDQITTSTVTVTETETETKYPNHQTILINKFEKSILEDLETSEGVREVLFGMIDSVEYIASLEFEKNLTDINAASMRLEAPLVTLKEFDESSFAASSFQDPFDLREGRPELSEDLLRSEAQHREALQVSVCPSYRASQSLYLTVDSS